MARARTVLIAGAGIGGLAAALALAREGYRAVVFERSESAESAGAGIQLSPNATRALKALGVLDALRENAVEPPSLVISNGINRALLANAPLHRLEARYGAPYLVCSRSTLHDVLRAAAADHPDIELRYGAVVEDFAGHARGVTALVGKETAREEVPAIALIGADGIRSAVRARLFPGISPVPARMSAWRATIAANDLPEALRGPAVRVWLGPGAHLVHYPVGGGEINLVAVANDPRAASAANTTWGEPSGLEEVAPAFSGWHELPRAVLALGKQFRRWPLFDLPRLPRWGDGATVLLGDAAHAMLPFIAQGAGCALEDAVVLAEKLKGAADIPAALRSYHAVRAARATALQRTARNVGRVYHLNRPWSLGRDLAIERIGGEGLLARNGWIYRG